MALDSATLCEWLCLPEGAILGMRPATLAEVFALSHVDDWPRPSARWTKQMLQRAHEQCNGRWYEIGISLGAALRVILPKHAGEPCHGDTRELLPEGGLDLATAAAGIAAWDEAARAESRECWDRIRSAGTCPLSSVVLSTAPLADHPDYAMLPPGPALFHLDGLHRLLGWALSGRLHDSPDQGLVALLADPWALDARESAREGRSARGLPTLRKT